MLGIAIGAAERAARPPAVTAARSEEEPLRASVAAAGVPTWHEDGIGFGGEADSAFRGGSIGRRAGRATQTLELIGGTLQSRAQVGYLALDDRTLAEPVACWLNCWLTLATVHICINKQHRGDV